ncbi:MAG: amidohydrolase family protein [Solirubrobacterales bacterium]|nr:amidohydrolase family protein [Solirubrobacterales bacterium]
MSQPKVVALEEHWWPAELATALHRLPPARRDDGLEWFNGGERARRLADLDDERLRDMDAQGVDVSVISVTTPGVQPLRAAEAVALARAANDEAAAAVARHPNRLAAFATLPTPDGEAAAAELERAVETLGMRGAMLHGRTGDRHLDDPALGDMFAVAGRLDVPLYIHPQMPSRDVRSSYYDGFSGSVDAYFAGGGWGWHMETGIEAVRLILAGTFDRIPNLQIVLGHWGEMVVFFLERLDIISRVSKLQRSVADYVKQQFSVTPSGILNQRLLVRAIEEIGVERVMLSTDYPFQYDPERNLKTFLARSQLSSEDQQAVAAANAVRLLGLT